MNDNSSPTLSASFPNDDSLCEWCGYSLRGLARGGDCPECGSLIGLSDPVRRTGLPWQQKQGWRRWLSTCAWMLTRPGFAFGRMQVGAVAAPAVHNGATNDRTNRAARRFLSLVALLAAAITARIGSLIHGSPAWLHASAAPLVLIILTYIEAMGVTFFARRRGWRVPWHLAERIVCYASIAWLPAMLILPPLILLQAQAPFLPRWATWIPLRGELTDWLIIVIVGGIASLWFETLVWLGVRRLRFANA